MAAMAAPLRKQQASVEDLLYSKAVWSRPAVDPWLLQQQVTANHLFSRQAPLILGQCLQLSKSDENVPSWRLSQRILHLSSLLRESGAMILLVNSNL